MMTKSVRAAAVTVIILSLSAVLCAADAKKLYEYGLTYQKQKNYKNAVSYYSAAIKQDPSMWQAWLGLGLCEYSMGNKKNAELNFRKVLSLKPGEPTAEKYYAKLIKERPVTDANKRGEPKPKKSKGEMMWRSAVLPGFGQFYNEEYVKGYVYSLAFLASVGGVIKFTTDQQRAVDLYNNANTGFEEKYKAAEEATFRTYIPIGTAALFWGLSIADAWLSGEEEKPSSGRRFTLIEHGAVMDLARVDF